MRGPDQALPRLEATTTNPDSGEQNTFPDPREEEVWEFVSEDANKRLMRVIHPLPVPTIPPTAPDRPVAAVTTARTDVSAAEDAAEAPIPPDAPAIPDQRPHFIIDGFLGLERHS